MYDYNIVNYTIVVNKKRLEFLLRERNDFVLVVGKDSKSAPSTVKLAHTTDVSHYTGFTDKLLFGQGKFTAIVTGEVQNLNRIADTGLDLLSNPAFE